jgi:cytochrome c oxidase subunit II
MITLLADILPPQSSTFAADVDNLFWFIHWLSLFFLVAISGAAVYFVLRWRRGHKEGPGPSHNLPMELTWSIVPLILVMAIFLWGFRGYMHMSMPPRGAEVIEVTAQKWSWSFQYSNGQNSPDLHVPVDEPVRLNLHSQDVLHSIFIRAFRQKIDVVPGRYTSTWFEATQVGEYEILCTEYCGDGHSRMMARVIVEDRKSYDEFVKSLDKDVIPTLEIGQQLYMTRQCVGCHSLDGTPRVGPTWKGVFGKTEAVTVGPPVMVDEAYITESILNPAAKIVAGFPPAMPAYQGQLKPGEIAALIMFIKAQQ